VTLGGIGEDVYERAVGVPVRPAALSGEPDKVGVVEVERDAERIRAVLVVIVVEVAAESDPEVVST
jgi:hypothetical protein